MKDYICVCGSCDCEWKQSGDPDTLKVSCPECFDDDDIAWYELEDDEHEESDAEAKLRGVLLACRNMRRAVNLTPEVEVWVKEIEQQAGDEG